MGKIVSEEWRAASAARVLIVDDEPPLVRGLRVLLRGAGYVAESARTAADAFELAVTRPPGVVLLDSALPDGEGVDVCRELRRLSKVSILMMSAAGAQSDRLRALDAGADDYLRKPFGAHALLERLSVLSPRSVDGETASTLQLGELVIDFARRRVTRAGAVVLLGPTEFELVRVLAERPGRIVTDRQLLGAVWGPEYGRETHRLRVSLARLRARLQPDPSRPRYLIAEPGVGYRLGGADQVLR